MKKEEADAFLDEWEDEVGKTVPSEHFPIEVLREQEIVLDFFKQMLMRILLTTHLIEPSTLLI